MLKVSFLEFLLRGIPEGLLFFLAAHAFTKNKIEVKKYLLSSMMYSIMVYLIRFLPIDNGVDSILNLVVLIALITVINKFEIIKTIKAGIIIMLLEFVCEGLNFFMLQAIMKEDLNSILKQPMLKMVYSSPSLLIFGCIVITYYFRLCKRKELKCISYGEIN